MKVEIWSDVVCPWCYVGKRRLEQALSTFGHADEVEVEWKAYELDPHGPVERPGTYIDRLSAKYGISVDEAQARIARMVRVGADVGIQFRFDASRPGNTFDAHRLLHLAASLGLQDELAERLFSATFTDGHPIGDPETLVKLAADVGIAEADTRRVLESSEYSEAVRRDEAEAMTLGVQAVPYFVFDRRYAVGGAQKAHVLLEVLERAWAEVHPLEVIQGGGDLCEGDACDV